MRTGSVDGSDISRKCHDVVLTKWNEAGVTSSGPFSLDGADGVNHGNGVTVSSVDNFIYVSGLTSSTSFEGQASIGGFDLFPDQGCFEWHQDMVCAMGFYFI